MTDNTDNTHDPDQDSLGDDRWVDDLLGAIAASAADKQCKVVLYNDEDSDATLVKLALTNAVTAGDTMKASYLMLCAHFEGHKVIFEGSTMDADKIVAELRVGGWSNEWLDAVKRYVPQVQQIMHLGETLQAMQGDPDRFAEIEGMLPFSLVSELGDLGIEALYPENINSYLVRQETLERPVHNVTVVDDGCKIPAKWAGTTVLS